ncbi:pre-mRNA-splicing factor Clf1p [[Candida] jaroonii]|uniref:Pre-mRNA-splicing factor Clf1p n=1 Tax=[Candida] jaroonii TaxID=467808 RepID=A0ACA9YGA0_9ASCO|nr:pre-mRNA-splicing factor Clf1p [[Candida] jaroonii]
MSQITSEEIIRDSYNQRVKLDKPQETIQDIEELRSFQLKKRREFEQQINLNRLNFGVWIRYAKWEVEFNHDFKRARSIYERALQVNIEHIPFWINYIKFELSNNNINHARNILDRAITTLPHVEKFWYMYVQAEEALQDYTKVRTLFRNWIDWRPSTGVWDSWINFEKRYDEVDNVRDIFRKYVTEVSRGEVWMKWINFEMELGNIEIIRNVFELSVDTLLKSNREDEALPDIVLQFSIWEYKQQETERANEIFKLILDKSKFRFTENQHMKFSTNYYEFERNYRFSDDVAFKRKLKYISNVESNPNDIDSWWTLISLSQGNETLTNLEKSVSTSPPEQEKTLVWKRYIFLWIKLAFYYEFSVKNIEKARETWIKCVEMLSGKSFSFAKIWTNYADFEIRQNDLAQARKIMGRAIGSMIKPKDKVFKYYIALEKKLGEWDRIRKIFEKWFELSLIKSSSAIKVLLTYVDFEKELGELDRCENLFLLGLKLVDNSITGEKLTPYDLLYTSFINYYKENFEYDKARSLYEQLISENDDVKVWISFANFESSIPNESQLMDFNSNTQTELEVEIEETQKEKSRKVFERALNHFKTENKNEERLIILQAWKSYEMDLGDNESLSKVEKKFPTIAKRTKTEDNITKEYLEYVFPEEKPDINKFLQNAKKWAAAKS